jgi:YidC/Oxa1 family membrane protein insertase
VARQSPEAAANPQTALMNKLALYVFPLGVVVGGPFLPIAIILYWFANNIWTFGQQHYVFGMIAKEDEAKKREVLERRAANAPAPGAKPNRARKAQAARAEPTGAQDGDEDGDVDGSVTEPTTKSGSEPNLRSAPKSGSGSPGQASANRQDSGARRNGAGSAGRTPRPGARPKRRKR